MKKKIHQENKLIWACLIGESLAFILAIFFRYYLFNFLFSNPTRETDFYKMFIIVVLFMYSAVFIFRRGRRPYTWETGGFGRLIEVIKQHVTLLIILLFFLYFIHWSNRVSRTVMALLIVFGMFFDLVIRQVYGKRRARRYIREDKLDAVMLVCLQDEGKYLETCINRYGYQNDEKELSLHCRVAEHFFLEEGNNEGDRLINKLEDLTAKGDPQNIDMIYISFRAAKLLGRDVMRVLEGKGIPVCRSLELDGKELSGSAVSKMGGSAAVYQSLMTLKCPVFGVNYTTAGKAEVADYLIRNSRELSGQYVCFSNVHTTVMAADDEGYRDVLNASAFTFPDGTPVADMIWKQGYIEAERVAGPDLMAELFRRCLGNHKKHYFYGSTEETLSALSDKLKKNYPWMEIAGMYSPPFRPLTEEEDAEVVKMINDSGADFVWIGLGAPKQELWMAEHKGRIKGLMLGVGAGFDFHAGRVKRAPVIVQKLGMEWFYRLMQDPKRLLKRYFITNTKFIIYSHIKYRGK